MISPRARWTDAQWLAHDLADAEHRLELAQRGCDHREVALQRWRLAYLEAYSAARRADDEHPLFFAVTSQTHEPSGGR